MPNYKKHLLGGLATFLLLSTLFVKPSTNILITLQWLIVSLIGSLFPDIDTKSKIQKIFYTSLLFLFFYLIINKQNSLLIAFAFIGLLPLIVNHRGIFHKAWFILLISLSSLILSKMFAPMIVDSVFVTIIYFTAAVFSHLILDLGIRRAFKF